MFINKSTLVVSLSLLAALSTAQTYYVTQGNRLYKFKSVSSITSVQLKLNGKVVDGFSSLAFDPSGVLWGHAGGAMYKINPTSGAVTKQWSFASGNGSNTFDFRVKNGVVQRIGFVFVSSSNSNALARKVASSGLHLGDYTVAGASGLYAASAYDPVTGKYYAAVSNTLKSFDPDVANKNGVIVGTAPLSKAILAGGAFWKGVFYLAYRNAQNGAVFFTHYDKTQGKFVNDFSATATQMPYQSGMGYAIGPS
jgi:hypothetical protein